VKVFHIFLVSQIQPTAYAFSAHFPGRSLHDLQPKTAILRQKPLR